MASPVRILILAAATLAAGLSPYGAAAQSRCAGYVAEPKPQNADRDIVGQDLDEITERGFITFAVYEDFAPWSWEDKGTPAGVDVDLARLIAKDLGVEARFNFVQPAEDLANDLRNYVWKGPIVSGTVSNVMMHVPYDLEFACRVDQVVFTGQSYTQEIAIAYSKAAYPEDPPTPAYFRIDTVGVENDSLPDFYLSGFAGGQMQPNIRRYPTTAAAMAALSGGEVYAVMGPRGDLEYGLTPELALHEPPLPGLAVHKWPMGVAVRTNYRDLAYRVDDTLQAARADGRMAAIFGTYGLTYLPPDP